uniref:Major facilitator superfamily (MFS) profile domain-containing protein n=1 Tax=Micromonas pusilla TaxID=38833 RepID=A0A7S0IN39_MICPS|mmetsp:Transcript_9970/g.40943  ORF Transcript_9970/g.40943 Transcript_9970/m.40943 type:complete len:567 (+) Transcript_9970:83-1783(+)
MVLAITCKHEFPRRWAQSRQQQTSRLLSSCGVFQAANRSRSSASNTRLYAAICAFVPGKAYFTKRQHLNVNSLRTSSKVVASSATPLKQTIDPETGGYSRSFLLVRVAVFFSILIGYACYYLTRNSLTFTAPAMVASPALGLDITSIGVITSIFPLCYGCSKFVSGVVGDVLSPSIMLGGGLIATGMVNIAFGASTTLPFFCFLWAVNGILQGFGAPSCAKILTSWFAAKERGTYWGMWNIAHNLGGFAAPILAGTAARTLGWSWGLWAPGIIALFVGSLIMLTLKDSPEARGFSPVEQITVTSSQPDHNESEIEITSETSVCYSSRRVYSCTHTGNLFSMKVENLSLLDNLFRNVLSNPFIWGLAFTYFCVYVVRQGITSWSVFYLIKEKGVIDAGAAAVRVSGLELGGLLGSLIAGRISDWYIATSPGGAVGKRIQVVMAYLIGVAAMLLAFKAVPSGLPFLQAIIVFMVGFFLYGPQMLIGLCGAEIVGRRSVGASEGFLGWIAYLGAANAGVPLSLLVQQYGWNAFFSALLLACAAAILLLAPITSAQSHIQRSAKDQAILR